MEHVPLSSSYSPRGIRGNWLAFVTGLVVVCTTSQAETFFVAPTGNNANPGSSNQPWKTIAQAVHKMRPGDTTFARGGVYQEGEIRFRRSGTAAEPIRLLNYPNERPVIEFVGTSSRNRVFMLHEAGALTPIGWLALEGFEIRNSVTAFMIYNAHNVSIRRNWIHHSRASAVMGIGKDIHVDGNIINHNGDFEGCMNGASHWSGAGTVCNKDHGIYGTGQRWTITNNLIFDNLAAGIHIAGRTYDPAKHADATFSGAANWLIANNTIAYNNNGPGIFLSSAFEPGLSTRWSSKLSSSGDFINVSAPSFENAPPSMPAAPRFTLRSGSPAINRGLNLFAEGVTVDSDGKTRPRSGPFEIGAYEFGSHSTGPLKPRAPSGIRVRWARAYWRHG